MKEQELPEGCIAEILSYAATPADLLNLSLVSKAFASASEYDTVWGRFIPSDLSSFLPSSSIPSSTSKKALYYALSDNPTIIDQGKKVYATTILSSSCLILIQCLGNETVLQCCVVSLNFFMQSFQLEKRNGKKCFMLSARDLNIIWGGTSQYWKWTNLPQSRLASVYFSFSFTVSVSDWSYVEHVSITEASITVEYSAFCLVSTSLGVFVPQSCSSIVRFHFTLHQKEKSVKTNY